MEEKHTCQCNNKSSNDDLKKLEILALGTYSQRLMNKLMVFIAVIIMMSIVAGTIIAVYGINRYHNYIMNTEVVESVETVEEYTEEVTAENYSKEDYDTAGSIVKANNNTLNNSNLGVDNGNIKNQNSYKNNDEEKAGNKSNKDNKNKTSYSNGTK